MMNMLGVHIVAGWTVLVGGYGEIFFETFYPCLEGLGIDIAGEWEVLIGDGQRILCEGRAQETDHKSTLIGNLRSKTYLKAVQQFKKFGYII